MDETAICIVSTAISRTLTLRRKVRIVSSLVVVGLCGLIGVATLVFAFTHLSG